MYRYILICISFIFLFTYLFASDYSAKEISQRLFAVHATDVFPSTGFVISGFGDDDELPENLPNCRSSIHFAIGELVRPLGEMSWEDRKYAIVTPLDQLYPQLVNLNCYDTFIIGDFELNKGTVVLVPAGTKYEGMVCEIIEYGVGSSLREAVDTFITSHGGWNVRMLDDNIEEEYAPALVGNNNINSNVFFQPILDLLPHLSLGLRWEPHHGEAWRFSEIEMILLGLHDEFYGDGERQSVECLQRSRKDLLEHYEMLLKTYLDAPLLSEKSKKALSESLNIVNQWIQMIDFEIQKRADEAV
ncbi:MAG: hypothetical protein K1060chlam4_00781 [Candidatus Anoxychlamydiales bacterium]|nr:hypothetical protein [Candidatus Anoxychlamydiales bacterium]